MPGHHWESDTPTYKIRVNLNGDKATMYFECHYIDPKTSKVVAQAGVTHTLQKVNGQWLITELGRVDRHAEPLARAWLNPNVLEAPPTRRRRAALGGLKDRLVATGRPRAGDRAHEAARRVPRHRRRCSSS